MMATMKLTSATYSINGKSITLIRRDTDGKNSEVAVIDSDSRVLLESFDVPTLAHFGTMQGSWDAFTEMARKIYGTRISHSGRKMPSCTNSELSELGQVIVSLA